MREANHSPSRRGRDRVVDDRQRIPAHPAVIAAYRTIIARWVRQRREAQIIEVQRTRGVEAR